MRIATYNVEWFNTLFDDAGQLCPDQSWSGRHNVTRARQIAALGHVFKTLDADAVLIVEAPDSSRRRDTARALQNFAARFDLRTNAVEVGFLNDTQQELALLYDPRKLSASHDPMGADTPEAPRFDGTFRIDLDIDASEDQVRFSKPPLELAIKTQGGTALRLIGAHLKSKAPHGARGRDAIIRQSIANRRKQLAQAIWLRARVEQHLARGQEVIVLGDLNDGPGLDEYEHLFGRSSVEIIMGEDLNDPHARQAMAPRPGAVPSSARFLIEKQGRYLQALLDYVMLSPGLAAQGARWRIWHPFEDHACWSDPVLRDALLDASDHFPVSVDLQI